VQGLIALLACRLGIAHSTFEAEMEIPGQNMPAWRLGKMRHAMRAIPFLLAVGALPALAATLPAYCGGVGAKSYTPPAVTIPAVVLNRGTVITVTNTSMLINDDTSSVSAPPESRASTWWPEWMPRVQTRCSSCWWQTIWWEECLALRPFSPTWAVVARETRYRFHKSPAPLGL